MKNLLIILFLIIISACTTVPIEPIPIITVDKKVININPKVLEQCDPLQRLPEKAGFEDVITITIRNYELYKICADKQRVSTQVIREFSNSKE
jgi:hypothetical protein